MKKLLEIFSFSEDTPLLFTQINFWIFFAFVYLIYAIIYKKKNLRIPYLFIISLTFYYKTSGLFVGLLIFSTIYDFFLGKKIYNTKSILKKKILVALSVIINLATLCYFKYAYFFTDSFNSLFKTDYEVINHLSLWANYISRNDYFTIDSIILPVGISFYTFQTISYSVDIYRKQLKPINNIIDFGFFVSFFPQLVAGPIVRAADFIPQIRKEINITKNDFGKAVYMILTGLVKKMIFADYIAANFLDRVFDAPEMFSGFANIMALFGYSLQIYGDFSGYTDIAIGIALLMGYTLPKNFNSPYKAINCGDFWKRWHISLSTWLKDYLYIPLGGNKKGSVASYIICILLLLILLIVLKSYLFTFIIIGLIVFIMILCIFFPKIINHFNTNINILLTMLIGGLWHGASWKFVIWGGLNGLGIIVYKYWRRISPYEKNNSSIAMICKIGMTFIFITFTRVYFRGNSMEQINKQYYQILHNMNLDNALQLTIEYRYVFLIMLLGYITHWLPYSFKDSIKILFIKSHIIIKAVVVVIISILCYQTYAADFQPFIYFQF